MRNPIDNIDHKLIKLRTPHPIIGWILTVVCCVFALALSVGFVLSLPLLVPAGLTIGIITVMVFAAVILGLVITRRFNKNCSIDINGLFDGVVGNVVIILCVVIAILLLLLFLTNHH